MQTRLRVCVAAGGVPGADWWFNIDEKTGVISTLRSIDREQLCPRAADCFVKFDVTVQPIQFFQIIKVAFCRSY